MMAVNMLLPPKSSINQKFFAKLSTVGGVIVRGNKIIPPDAPEHVGGINVCTKMLNIAHEGYSGGNAIRRYVRSTLWFPKMDEEIVKPPNGTCHAKPSFYSNKNQRPPYTILSS